MSREVDIITRFRATVCDVVGAKRCHPIVHRTVGNGDSWPSIVYLVTGSDTIFTLGGGPQIYRMIIRYEVRAKTYAKALEKSAEVVEELRKRQQLISILSDISDYDDDLDIYRHIRSVIVR